MPRTVDGPASPLFTPLPLKGTHALSTLSPRSGLSKELCDARAHAPSGKSICWGIPFDIGKVVVARDKPITVNFKPVKAPWLVAMHTSDHRPNKTDKQGLIKHSRGDGEQGEHAADYVFLYADGREQRVAIRRRFEVGPVQRRWGENSALCVPHVCAHAAGQQDERPSPMPWGFRQYRAQMNDLAPWTHWLWAFENPRPGKAIVGLRIEPVSGALVLAALSAGRVASHPLRWVSRQKVLLQLPKGQTLDPVMDEQGLFKQIGIDLGQVISLRPRLIYPDKTWSKSRHNLQPARDDTQAIVEYAAHPEARFYVGKKVVKNEDMAPKKKGDKERKQASAARSPLQPVAEAVRTVRIRTVDARTKKPVPTKLHVHGAHGEYLTPTDRHRIPNGNWFEDYGAEYLHGDHWCCYISGETALKLPLGDVFIEVTKGFEIRPVRRRFKVTRATKELVIELEKVLPWRERGWVTSDTHVHFLSPATAQLEGSAEGVNIINLLASQWGELMTNAGDFDGQTTFGSKEAGGDGEWLVRVGTENRQHVLGHISLLGYEGNMITPMCTGGPNESAMGDPVEILMTEWARMCRQQGGLVIMPHFPQPRMENAACLVLEEIDGVEMCSHGDHYSGISPYSLSDWYRYLNCGYLTPAVGGTDKMSQSTAVGTIRTYARIPDEQPFTYSAWMESVKRCETFVSYGPLLEFDVEGHTMGRRMSLPAGGGTVDVRWRVASVTMPLSKVELVVNGEVVEGQRVKANEDEGAWSVKVPRSSWMALLVRGKYRDKPEMIAAHSSPVMAEVKGTPFFAAADAVTILEQIEGAMAFLDTLGTRADARRRKEMRLILESAYRRLHNRMHADGHTHSHGHATHHKDGGEHHHHH